MKRYLAFLWISLVLFSACKGTKNTSIQGVANSNLSLSKVINLHDSSESNFKTLASRVQVVYEDSKKRQSITVSLRMEKDKVIWIKASILGITLAKALITPQRVSYYETINNSYFDGDFALISDLLGADLDFEKTQALLLGQSIFDFDKKYKVSVANNQYQLAPKDQPLNFMHSVFLYPDSFKVASASLAQPNEGRLLQVTYGPYQNIENTYYPSHINIDAAEADEKTTIYVNYKKIDINPKLSFPFTIPDGYELINLSP